MALLDPKALTLRIPDDRGAIHALPERDEPWGPADPRLRRVRRQQTSLLTGGAAQWALLGALFLAMLVALGSGAPPIIVYGAVFVLGMGLVHLGIASTNRKMEHNVGALAHDWSNAALRRGLCPVCEYNLHGVGSAPDGCIVCPECGSAWQESRVGRTLMAPPAKPISLWSALIEPAALNSSRLVDDQARRHLADGLRSLPGAVPSERGIELTAAVRDLRRAGAVVRIAIALLLLLPVIGAIGLLSLPVLPGTARFAALITPLFLLWLAIMVLRSDIGVAAAARIRALLAADFCPVCGADLGLAPVAEEGRIVCPDCGARWRRGPKLPSADAR